MMDVRLVCVIITRLCTTHADDHKSVDRCVASCLLDNGTNAVLQSSVTSSYLAEVHKATLYRLDATRNGWRQ